MFGEYKSDRDRKRSIIAMLIQMATVDDNIDPVESRFIADVASGLDLSSDDIVDVIRKPKDFVIAPPADEHSRMEILYYLLFTMRVDGIIDLKEEALCFKAGLRLGFNELLTGDLINVMKTYLKEDIPPEAMLEHIRKYLN